MERGGKLRGQTIEGKERPMNTQLLIFDLDGTLVDSRADIAAATNRMRAMHGLEALPLAEVEEMVGDGIRTLAVRALGGAAVDAELAAKEIGEAYADRLVEQTTPYEGVDEGLRALAEAGHALALATNKPGDLARGVLEHFGWTGLFRAVLGGGDLPELKPSPLPLRVAMERCGHGTDSTWMVGDHHTDLEAARRAGVRSVFLEYGIGHAGAEKADATFAGFREFAGHFLVQGQGAGRKSGERAGN